MEDNPYSEFLRVFRMDAEERSIPSFFMGKVLNASPLEVDVAGLTQRKENLRINDTIRNSLKKGDEVLLLPGGELQNFIVICKVVSV